MISVKAKTYMPRFACRVISTQPRTDRLPLSLRYFKPPPPTYYQPRTDRLPVSLRYFKPPPPTYYQPLSLRQLGLRKPISRDSAAVQNVSLAGCPMCRQLGMDPYCLSQ